MKERACYLATNPQREETVDTERINYVLPDGSSVEVRQIFESKKVPLTCFQTWKMPKRFRAFGISFKMVDFGGEREQICCGRVWKRRFCCFLDWASSFPRSGSVVQAGLSRRWERRHPRGPAVRHSQVGHGPAKASLPEHRHFGRLHALQGVRGSAALRSQEVGAQRYENQGRLKPFLLKLPDVRALR